MLFLGSRSLWTRLLFILIQLHQKLSRSRSLDRIMPGLDSIGYYNCMDASGYYSSFMMAINRKSSILHQNFFLVLCSVYNLYCSSKFLYPVGVIIYCNTYVRFASLVWISGSSSLMQIGRGKAKIEAGGGHWEVIWDRWTYSGSKMEAHWSSMRLLEVIVDWVPLLLNRCAYLFILLAWISLSFHYLLTRQLITESVRSVSHQNFHLEIVTEGFPASWS